MEEIWKDIPGYEGYYQVSNVGSVKSITRTVKHWRKGPMIVRERILRPHKGGTIGNQYLRVNLSKEHTVTLFFVHKLVADSFVPNPSSYTCVNHLDRNTFNNRADNLEWVTIRENVSYSSASTYTKLKGAYWNKRDKKWRSAIYINKKLHHLGEFGSEVEASNAYKAALANLKLENRYAI